MSVQFILSRFHFISSLPKSALILENNVKTVKRQLRGLPRSLDREQSNSNENASTLHEITTKTAAKQNLNQLRTTEESNNFAADLQPVKKDYVPTFNLAAYVNKSTTLQECVKLGVDLHSIERRKGLAQFMLRLDFEQNIKPYLIFLKDQNISPALFGELITKNPLIFKVDLDDLQTRVNYLEAKKFTPTQIQRILTLNPFWLMYSTRRIDRRLGYFQQEFKLSGNDIRFLASKQPNLITYNMDHIHKATFCIREEMGFDKDEIKCLLLAKPRLWMMNSDILIERFAYVHQEMQLSHDMLLRCPEVLTSRDFRIRQRHEFLKSLGRAQYNPEKDLYVSPRTVVEGNDFQFVRDVAKSNMETYDLFLKTR